MPRKSKKSRRTVLSQDKIPSKKWFHNYLSNMEQRISNVEYHPSTREIQGLKSISKDMDYYKPGFDKFRMKGRSDKLKARLKALKKKHGKKSR